MHVIDITDCLCACQSKQCCMANWKAKMLLACHLHNFIWKCYGCQWSWWCN